MSSVLSLLSGDLSSLIVDDGIAGSSRAKRNTDSSKKDSTSFSAFLEQASVKASTRREEIDGTDRLDLVGATYVANLPLDSFANLAENVATGANEHDVASGVLVNEYRTRFAEGAEATSVLGGSTEEGAGLVVDKNTPDILGAPSELPAILETRAMSRADVEALDVSMASGDVKIVLNGREVSLDDVLAMLALDFDGVVAASSDRVASSERQALTFGSALAEIANVLRFHGFHLSIQTRNGSLRWVGDGFSLLTQAASHGGGLGEDVKGNLDVTPERFQVLELAVHDSSASQGELLNDLNLVPEVEVQEDASSDEMPVEHSHVAESSAPYSFDGGRVQGVGFLRLVEIQGLRSLGLERIGQIEQLKEGLAQTQVSRISIEMTEFGEDARLHVGLVGGKTVHAKIIVSDAVTRENLVAHLEQLRATLEHRGYEVGRIRVLPPSTSDVFSSLGGRDLSGNSSGQDSGAHERAFGDHHEQHERRQRNQQTRDLIHHFFYGKYS